MDQVLHGDIGQRILTDRPYHDHSGAIARGGDGLIGSLTTCFGPKLLFEYRLARSWHILDREDKIRIDRTECDDYMTAAVVRLAQVR
ncbi:hypothetical protein NKH69_34160 [Mesorhizobium sp. M0976]|uniref:hypothetical protein n=1 Tax=Mesorhizobium sp. M0976 TaxID=2957038 RepID=UPI0033381412